MADTMAPFDCDGGACTVDEGEADMGIECPGCGGRIDRIDKGDVFVCEKGRPPMREARYRCRHCGSTVIFLRRCEPERSRR